MILLLKTVFLIELINTTIGSGSLLLAGVEGVALGAHLYVDLRLGGTGHERVTAVAGNGRLIVLGMDTFFHFVHLSISMYRYCFVLIRTVYGTTNSFSSVA
jgi:hypothetical protein